MKTNKTFLKRLKISKNGKIQARGKGHNHYNAKEGRRSQFGKKRMAGVVFTNQEKARFLGGSL